MTWPEATLRVPFLRRALGWLLLAGLALAPSALPAAEDDMPQVWLLTYGPGEIYWQRFGHNAIWIRDPGLALDHTFNFGFFDFEQENFLRNFLLGRLNYFSAARPAQVEMAEYIDENRAIRAQRLDLEPEQHERLTRHLLSAVSIENREYLYDYYLNNCSTRIRDALDIALDGALRAEFQEVPAPLSFRAHTRRLTGMDYWLYLGLQTGLGSPIDRPIDRWAEFFIPETVAEAMISVENPATGKPVVAEDVVLYESTLPQPPEVPRMLWHRYLVFPAAILLLAAGLVWAIRPLKSRHLAVTWLVVAGLFGCVLAFFWMFTDHWVTRLNLNLLLLNPLWLLIAVVPALRQPGAWFILACGLMAVVAPWLPPGQYNADVAAFVWPLNLASALLLIQSRKFSQ